MLCPCSVQVAGEGLVGDVFAKYRRPNKYYYDDSGFTPATQRTIGKTERQYYANLVSANPFSSFIASQLLLSLAIVLSPLR